MQFDDEGLALYTSAKWACCKQTYKNTGRTHFYLYRLPDRIGFHRLLCGAARTEFVDHINGDGLNNTRSNLRVTTYSQNSMNIQKTRGRTGMRGVYAQGAGYLVRVAGEYFGYYTTEAEAAFHANRALDSMSPGAGMRNPVDNAQLLSIWRARKAEIDALINLVTEPAL